MGVAIQYFLLLKKMFFLGKLILVRVNFSMADVRQTVLLQDG